MLDSLDEMLNSLLSEASKHLTVSIASIDDEITSNTKKNISEEYS
jgi:hypothetical protein